MHAKVFSAFFLFCCAAGLPAQTSIAAREWNVQAFGFVARYHADIDYKLGSGAGLAIGRFVWKNRFSCSAGFEYTRAAQKLSLIDGLRETHVGIYRSFVELRGHLPINKRVVSAFAGALGGWSFFRPQALTINAGALGEITLHPKDETKFLAAWSSGFTVRLLEEAAALFSVKQYFSRFAWRQLQTAQTQNKWRPYWNYGVGLSWNF
jgi:hypothetical protein